MITLIKFPSTWKCKYDTDNTGIAEFKLGLGPCGLTVTKLHYRYNAAALQVRQYYTDGTCKDFIYNWTDITGRVEVEYSE